MRIATRVVVLIHVKEWHRSSNTGYLARLGIEGSEVRIHGSPHRRVETADIEAGAGSTLVLYLGRGAEPLTARSIESLPRPWTLLVPDGNWTQAKNMMRRLAVFRQARPVRLAGPVLDLRQLRRNIYPDRMSTFPAIAQALGILESPATEFDLLAFFRKFLARVAPNQRRTSRH
jgi:DTW domain-containing protein YfiP